MKRFASLISIIVCSTSLAFAAPEFADGPLTPGPKPEDRPSVCLVLAGGGSRGFAHLPIIQAIEDAEIPIDMVVGTSIGAIVGGMYSAGYTIPEITKEFYNLDWAKLINDSTTSPYEKILDEHSINANIADVTFDYNFKLNIGKGMSNGQNIYSQLKEMTLKYPSNISFNKLHIPFRAVVTDMLNGEGMVIGDGDIAEAIRGSMSIPSIFQPAEMDGYYFIDGGIRYNLAINAAKNMGYDIIIGIDISQQVRDNPETFNSNPLVAMLNTITIGQSVSTNKLSKEATLVIYPDTHEYGTLDFKKGKSIYAKGAEAAEAYADEIAEIRKLIYPDDYDEDGNRISKSEKKNPARKGFYRHMPNLIPTELELIGALPQDESYINNQFKKLYDKELTPERFEDFIQGIYRTGNYISVIPRSIENDGETTIQLRLTKADTKSIKLILDADMEQTFGESRVTRFNFNPAIQLRGLTGSGSVISLRTKSINDFSAGLYYMQPFTPNFFIQMDSTWTEDHYTVLDSLKIDGEVIKATYNYTTGTSFRAWDSNINIGIRTDNGNLLKLNLFNKYGHTSSYNDQYIEDELLKRYPEDLELTTRLLEVLYYESPAYVAGARLIYTLDTMNRPVFAKKGLYVNSELCFYAPYKLLDTFDPSFVASLELRGAIPFGKYVTMDTDLFVGNEFTTNLEKNFVAIPLVGFSAYDRIYFPQITQKKYFGTKKAAGKISFQIDPFGDLTILGGGLLFRASGTVGIVANTYNQMLFRDETYKTYYPLLWTGSLDVGVRIKDGFNILIRGGAGSTYNQEKPIRPFFALDIGSKRF